MNVIKAISLKVMSALLFAVMSALVRFLGETYPVGQIVFFRFFRYWRSMVGGTNWPRPCARYARLGRSGAA